MRILDTGRKEKSDRFKYFLFIFALSVLVAGCVNKDELDKARESVARSQVYYQHAQERYKVLIAQGKNLDNLHLELGRLYYNHGDFEKAIYELKSSSHPEAVKLLGISFYRLGDFTEALEVFGRINPVDDEYAYFWGLTCEKLNLFDQASNIYRGIKGARYKKMALQRLETIEKETLPAAGKAIFKSDSKIIKSPNEADYPEAGALILSCNEFIEITKDNKEISTLHYLIKILNTRGKEDFSETSINYDSTFEKVELEFARTIKPDGTVVEVGSRHIRDVSKYMNFPLYSNVRAFIISFPEVAEGGLIEYKVKIRNNKLVNEKDFVSAYSLQATEPILEAKFSLKIPRDKRLHLKNINEPFNNFKASLAPVIEDKDGYFIYKWSFHDIAQIIPESEMPPEVEVNPAFIFSTFNDWQEIYNWWWALAKDKIQADSAIKEKVKELIRDKTTEEAKARSIYNFCAQHIRYVAIEYGQAGHEPHRAKDIFRNKYGDCKDQAILLVTMLKEAGLKAYPVLIPTREYFNLNDDFPSMLFNHCIASVSLEDKLIFLDPTAQTCSFDDLPPADQGRRVLIFKEDSFLISQTPVYPAGHNFLSHETKIKINPDETLEAQKRVVVGGLYDQAQRYWLLFTQPEIVRETLNQRIQEFSIGAKLKEYRVENLENLNVPVILSYSFFGPEYLTTAGNLRILPQLTTLDTSLTAKERRKYNIDFGILESKKIYFEIGIPDGFVVQYIPEGLREKSPWMDLKLEYIKKGKSIIFEQECVFKKTYIATEEYGDFKKFFESCAKKIKQRIVLEKVKK